MSGNANPTLEEWIASRPPAIQSLARRFPPGTTFDVGGRLAHVVSYVEIAGDDPGVMASFIDPTVDYDLAQAEKFLICGDHLT